MRRAISVLALGAAVALLGGTPAQASGGWYSYQGQYPSLYDCDAGGYAGLSDGWADYRCLADGGGYYSLYRVEY
jgi:hypothetical protein